MVVFFNGDTHLFHHSHHFGADIGQTVNRRFGEVAALDVRAVAEVAAGIFGAAVIRAFLAVDAVTDMVHVDIDADVLENEELGFRPDIDRIGDAGFLQVFLGRFGDGTRIAVIGFASGRFDDVAEHFHGRLGREGVHAPFGDVRLQDHVGFIDAFPAGDRGTVEIDAVFNHVLVDRIDVLVGMLPLSAQVAELESDILDFVFLKGFHEVACAFAGKTGGIFGFQDGG